MVDTEQRHSKAFSADLVSDPSERAEREAKNGLRQFDAGLHVIEDYVYSPDKQFRLRPSLILALQREALSGISAYAGNWRPAGVEIQGSKHQPPGAHLVPGLVEVMCDYVNENWTTVSAIHLAAYIMWRLNWIHPFADGNGRTSRILSYVVLCIRSGVVLPGTNTIPEQISENRNPYFEALDLADGALRRDEIDVSAMERLLEGYLARQLHSAYVKIAGNGN